MNIAVVSSPFFGTPSPNYGGLEGVVADCLRGLLDRGHKCVLFAPDESQIPKNGFLYKTGKALTTVNVDWVQAEKSMWEKYDKQLDAFDVVWASDWFGFEYLSKMRNPNLRICHTHHGGLNDIWTKTKPPFKLNMIAISNWMKRVYESQGITSQVSYNPVDLDRYKFQKEKGNRLLFVGRLDTFKQPHVAIEVAKKLNMGLDIIGGSFVQDLNYLNRIKILCQSPQITLHLDASHSEKIRLYQNAKAVLFPSRMGEPFGLIVPENSACGGFTIGLNDGAIPETINDGVNGYVVGKPTGQHSEQDDIKSLIDGVLKLESNGFDPSACRREAEKFSIERCAERYDHLFSEILNGFEW